MESAATVLRVLPAHFLQLSSSPKAGANKASQKTLAKIREIIAESLTRILRDGPEVSFNGSPTVSPTTAAL